MKQTTLKAEVLAALQACKFGGLSTREILAQCPLTKAACDRAVVKAQANGFDKPSKTPLESVLWALKKEGVADKGAMRDRCRVWVLVRK